MRRPLISRRLSVRFWERASIQYRTQSFVEIKGLDLDGTEEMVSFDVVSLFTKVPVKDAIDVVCSELSEDDTLFDRTELDAESIRKLMLACLECRYFLCQGSFYEQREGVPMGLTLSVVLANAYMEHLEESVLNTATCKPTIWRRYVDDTFIIWNHGAESLDIFHQHLNSFCQDIQFTVEREHEQQLPFLDVLVRRNRNKLTTSVYRKPMSSNPYLQFDSNHPPGMKAGIVKCLGKRAQAVCSEPVSSERERQHLRDVFQANGYPKVFIDKAMKNQNPATQDQGTESRGEKVYAKVPYGSVPVAPPKKDEMSLEEAGGELNLRCHGNIFGGDISCLATPKVNISAALFKSTLYDSQRR